MFKKILIIILMVTLLFIVSSCETISEDQDETPEECNYVRYAEAEESEDYNVLSGSYLFYGEDRIFKESNLILKGKVIDAKETFIEACIDGEVRKLDYDDTFTFEVEKIYYPGNPSIKAGDVIRVKNGSCPSDWIPGTLRMEEGKRYIVLTQEMTVHDNYYINDVYIELTEYFDCATTEHWASIILVEDGKYYVDEKLESLTDNALEEFVRRDRHEKDETFETTIYVKGEGFEDELEALILEKKGES